MKLVVKPIWFILVWLTLVPKGDGRINKDKKIDLAEILCLLDYMEYTAFFKAYKRWTGHSPSGLTC